MKTKRRLFSLLLAYCLVAGLMPASAFAAGADTGRAIQLGASGISGYDSADGYDYIYFGSWEAPDEHTTTGPLKWRVLDDQTNTGDAGLFLLSDALLGSGEYGGVYFQESYHEYGDVCHQGDEPSDGDHAQCRLENAWRGSDAQKWCSDFYSSNLTPQERDAVLATTKSDEAFISSDVYGASYAASESILGGDRVFFLSAEEAENEIYGFAGGAARSADYGNGTSMWWLRSPYAGYTDVTGAVIFGGAVSGWPTTDGWAARPAFNLDLDSVLFSSAAEGGKASGALGADALQAVSDYSGGEWKLTLKDGSRSFSATVNGKASAAASAGGSVRVVYAGAQTGANEYVSVLLCDSSGNVLYYGNIAQDSASGMASVVIPSGLAEGDYVLKVFSEQRNGDCETDYASAFEEIDLEIADSLQGATPNAGNGDNDNGGALSDAGAPTKSGVDSGAVGNTNGASGSKTPRTGDSGIVAPWVAAVLAAGATLIGTALCGRKRKRDR